MPHLLWWLYEVSLVQFESTWWCPNRSSCRTPWCHFCKDFLHLHIFGNKHPNTVFLNVQLTFNHLNNQPIIATHHLPYSLVDLSPTCWRPPAPWIIFHLFVPLIEPLVPLKNTCAQYGVISIHLLKDFKCLWGSFLQLDLKYQVYHSFNCAYSWTTGKRRGVNKYLRKNAIVK